MKNNITTRLVPYLIILLCSIFLPLLWFRNGDVLGTGESALPFYNLVRYREVTNYVWNDANLGGYLGNTMSSAPTYWVLSKIQDFGVPGYVIEAVVFGLLFFISGISILLLSRELLPKTRSLFLLLSVFFYWFNPISLVNVWNRFLNNYMFFWALLPVYLFLFFRGINQKKLKYSFYAAISTAILSYGLSNPAFSMLLMMMIVVTLLYYWFTEKSNKSFYVKYFIVTMLSFFLLNIWWLSQYFTFLFSSGYSDSVADFFTERGNMGILNSLSNDLGKFINTFRFVHSSYIETGPIWARIYANPIVALLMFTIPGLILLTMYKFRKLKNIMFLGFGFLTFLFLIKGNSEPFGSIFQLIFLKFSLFQVFRNTFEKFGFLLVLFAAPLVGFGLQMFTESIGRKILKRLVLVLGFVIVLVIYGFPFWTGLVFTSNEGVGKDNLRSYEVEVPNAYKEADMWLEQKKSDFRFVTLPLDGEGMTYTWAKPYLGVELTSALFSTPNISLNTTVPYYTNVATAIEKMTLKADDLAKVAPLINSKYVLLRTDVDWKIRKMTNPAILQDLYDGNNKYSKEKQFGELNFYSINGVQSSKLYVPSWGVHVLPNVSLDDYTRLSGKDGTGFMYSKDLDLPNINTTLLKVTKKSYIPMQNNNSFEWAMSSLLFARFLPDSPLYPLITLKEKIQRSQINTNDGPFIFDITNLGKRVVELYKLVEKNADQKIIKKSIDVYFSDLQTMKSYYPGEFNSIPENRFWGLVTDEFQKHKIILKEAKQISKDNSVSLINDALNKFNDQMIEIGVGTRNDLSDVLKTSVDGIWVYRFSVDNDGVYDITLDSRDWDYYYEKLPDQFTFQINDKEHKIRTLSENGLIKLGKFSFHKGYNEIIVAQPKKVNLLGKINDQYQLDSNTTSEYTFELNKYDGSSSYEISYDYWLQKGKSFRIEISYDNEPKLELNTDYFKRVISSDLYDHGYKRDSFIFTPRPGSTTMKIRFVADASNYCVDGGNLFGSTCRNAAYSRLFNKITSVTLKNLVFKKVFNNDILLSRDTNSIPTSVPSIKFVEINPTDYSIEIENASSPYVLIFSELFNSGWELIQEDGTKLALDTHFLANSYANGWLIEKHGSYKLNLKFSPQRIYDIGKIISILVVVPSVMFLGFRVYKKIKHALT